VVPTKICAGIFFGSKERFPFFPGWCVPRWTFLDPG